MPGDQDARVAKLLAALQEVTAKADAAQSFGWASHAGVRTPDSVLPDVAATATLPADPVKSVHFVTATAAGDLRELGVGHDQRTLPKVTP